MTLTEKEREFLSDTYDILIGYDGFQKSEDLMGLIDETRERLTIVLNGQIDEFEAKMDEKLRRWESKGK